ncbi:MAG: T9SS type A sorting domain-containing protein [Bacteroidota bacterium]
MKRSTLVLVISIVVAIESPAQIPNGSFENWTSSGICLQPQGWACINDWMGLTENCYSMSRSDDHYPASIGSFSIKIENRAELLPDWGAAGMVWTGDSTGFGTDNPTFPITGHPLSLCGYYKFFPQNGDTMDIHFVFYKNGVEQVQGRLIRATAATVWTSFNIPVSDPNYTEADSARIMMSAFYSDSFTLHGNSVLYVDNLSFDNLVTSDDKQTMDHSFFSVFPNPSTNYITLNFNKIYNEDIQLEIYNSLGVLVKTLLVNPNQPVIHIVDQSKGIYILVAKTTNASGVQKLIIY